jgi:hypothetical protein
MIKEECALSRRLGWRVKAGRSHDEEPPSTISAGADLAAHFFLRQPQQGRALARPRRRRHCHQVFGRAPEMEQFGSKDINVM